jgi:hypothetical protein
MSMSIYLLLENSKTVIAPFRHKQESRTVVGVVTNLDVATAWANQPVRKMRVHDDRYSVSYAFEDTTLDRITLETIQQKAEEWERRKWGRRKSKGAGAGA